MSADFYNCPRWLKELSCESNALTASEWNIVMKVQSMARRRFNVKTSYGNYGRISKELSYLVGSLKTLIKHQKMYEDCKRYFNQYYPQWRPIRDENIKILREIADKVQETKEACDGARVVGSIASLIGGGTSLAAEDEDSFAAKFGRGITLLGAAFAAGTTIAGEFVLHMKIEESKDTVEKDRRYFNRMWSCYVDGSETVASIDEIFEELPTNSYLWENVRVAIESFVSTVRKNSPRVNHDMSVQKLLNSINIPYKYQEEIGDVLSAVTAIVMVWKRHSQMFELVSKASKIKDQFESLTNGLLAVLNIWSKFESSNSKELNKSDVVAGMIMDLVSIVKTCEDASNGSQSRESDNIRKIADILENEADDLRRIYYRFV